MKSTTKKHQGELTDRIPPCMSEVVGRWIIATQDNMPDEMRNSDEWRQLLPLAAGTGRELEAERLSIVLDWMWRVVLPTLQALAEKHGFGKEWKTMCAERTAEAADAADEAAAWAADEGRAANAAGEAAWAALAAAEASEAAWAANAAAWAARAAANAANAAAWAARAAADAEADVEAAWNTFDPYGLLRKLIDVSPRSRRVATFGGEVDEC